MKRCSKCGTENKDENIFCKKCGAELPSTMILDNLIVIIIFLALFGIFSVFCAITGFNMLTGRSIIHEQGRIYGVYFFIPIVITFIAGYITFKTAKKELKSI